MKLQICWPTISEEYFTNNFLLISFRHSLAGGLVSTVSILFDSSSSSIGFLYEFSNPIVTSSRESANEVITGTSNMAASNGGEPNPSLIEGKTNKSALLYQAVSSSSEHDSTKIICSDKP